MAKNDFKAFATDRNANVMSQEEWEALPALLSGFTAGKASSAQVNKVIRQASFIAAALAQFVSDKTQRDVLDNGDLPGFVELLGSGFAVEYLSRKNPFGDIKSDGTVKTALENLGLGDLGTASGRNVGNTQSFEIPDMSYFQLTGKGSDNLLAKLPNGLIIQGFRRRLSNSTTIGIPTTIPVTYPTPFPSNVWGVFCTKATYAQIVTSCESATTTGFDAVTCLTSGTSPDSNLSDAYFFAIGY
ncbi:phage tail protein [Escherichia coli]|nr:phage tail protein [Escherichia coli]EFO2724670.1 phage tail protein [Escherichia coli]